MADTTLDHAVNNPFAPNTRTAVQDLQTAQSFNRVFGPLFQTSGMTRTQSYGRGTDRCRLDYGTFEIKPARTGPFTNVRLHNIHESASPNTNSILGTLPAFA